MKNRKTYFAGDTRYEEPFGDYGKSPLLIGTKTLFQLADFRRKKSSYKHNLMLNRSPIQSQMQDRKKDTALVQARQIEELANQIILQQLQQKELLDQIEKLKQENNCLALQNTRLQSQLDDIRISNQLLRSNSDQSYYQQQLREMQNLQEQKLSAQNYEIETLQSKLRSLTQQIKDSSAKELITAQVRNQLKELESLCLEMHKQIMCKLCNKEIQEAVTVIPCAHSYCKGCRRGYLGKCYICGDEQRVEATYINMFMNQMRELYKKNCELIKLFNI